MLQSQGQSSRSGPLWDFASFPDQCGGVALLLSLIFYFLGLAFDFGVAKIVTLSTILLYTPHVRPQVPVDQLDR